MKDGKSGVAMPLGHGTAAKLDGGMNRGIGSLYRSEGSFGIWHLNS